VNLFQRHSRLAKVVCATAAVALMIVAGAATQSDAATTTLYVKKNCGTASNCYTAIQDAIDAVTSPDTTIVVAPGKYSVSSCNTPACSVASILTTNSNGDFLDGLTLKCREVSGRSVVLDATGLDHGVYISGEQHVKIQGCVVENAGREGILVEDSSNVTIKKNDVVDNDKSLSTTPPCPTFIPPNGSSIPYCCPDAYPGGTPPGNFPEDNDDCGEGIHLRSVTSSVVESNFVHNNVGGILLTDETGANEGNLIAGNISKRNTLDCGITLASHTECTSDSTDATGCTACTGTTNGCTGANDGFGVVYNSVVGNKSIGNGAAGVGAFANPGSPVGGGAATDASSNLISDNVLKNNGQPGVAIHVHAENGRANHNVVIENVISGNGGDGEAVAGSPPPGMGIEVLSNGSFGAPFGAASAIVGTTISQNKVSGEPIDVWVGNTETSATVFLNDLNGAGKTGVQNDGTGTVVATDNWWNCPSGQGGGSSCSGVAGSGTIISSPFLHHPISPED
jgi:parallel beta-helix repeat protein